MPDPFPGDVSMLKLACMDLARARIFASPFPALTSCLILCRTRFRL